MKRFLAPLSLLLLLAATSPALPGDARDSVNRFRPAVDDIIIYQVKAGEDLPAIARRWFIDPENWRALQAFNHIANPLEVATGSELKVRRDWLRTVSMEARVLAFRGAVSFARDGKRQALSSASRLQEGDLLRTGRNGYATLQLPDGSRVSLPSASTIHITRLQSLPMSEEVDRQFTLESGQVDANVTPMTNPQSRFWIQTPVAVAAVRGTSFRVAYTPQERRLRAEVTHGRVLVTRTGSDDKVMLQPGFGTTVTSLHLDPAIALLAPPVLDSPDSIQQERLVHFRLRPMPQAAGYVFELASDAEFSDRIASLRSDSPVANFAGIPAGRLYLRAAAVDRYGLTGQTVEAEFERRQPVTAGTTDDASRVMTGLPAIVAGGREDHLLAAWQNAVADGDGAMADGAASEAAAGDSTSEAENGESAAADDLAATEGSDGSESLSAFAASPFAARSLAAAEAGFWGGGLAGSGGLPGASQLPAGPAGVLPPNRGGNGGGSGMAIIPLDPRPPESLPDDGNADGSENILSVPRDEWQAAGHPVPEPASWLLMIVGFALSGWVLRRRRQPVLE